MFYRRLIINGTEYPLAVGQKGSGAPGASTAGAEGITYLDTDTGILYLCTGAGDGVFTWKKVDGGLSDTAKAILVAILRNGVYSSDQSANITALEEALAETSGSGGSTGEEDSGSTEEGEESGDPVTYTMPMRRRRCIPSPII